MPHTMTLQDLSTSACSVLHQRAAVDPPGTCWLRSSVPIFVRHTWNHDWLVWRSTSCTRTTFPLGAEQAPASVRTWVPSHQDLRRLQDMALLGLESVTANVAVLSGSGWNRDLGTVPSQRLRRQSEGLSVCKSLRIDERDTEVSAETAARPSRSLQPVPEVAELATGGSVAP